MELETLEIKIQAQARQASGQIDALVTRLGRLSSALSGLNTGNLNSLSTGVNRLAGAMTAMRGIDTRTFSAVARNISKLGSINSRQINAAAGSMRQISNALKGISGMSASVKGLTELASAIKQLGYQSSTKAIENIPKLAVAMRQLMSELSKAPRVSQNIIDMTNALARLARTGGAAGSAARSITSSFSGFSSSASMVTKKSFSLASAIGKVYATYWTLFRAFRLLRDAIDISSLLPFSLNIGRSSMGQSISAEEMQAIAGSLLEGYQQYAKDNPQADYSNLSQYFMNYLNTEEARKILSDNIKEIIKDNLDQYETYFDYNRISYREWGIHELLNYSNGYKVKKVTVFPGMMMNLHQHELRAEYWSVVEGTATITIGTETKDYHKYDSVFVPIGVKHKVANKTDSNVVIIEVGIGDSILDNDMVKIYGQDSSDNGGNYVRKDNCPIVKLDPAFKDNLWGGTKIRDVYGKKCDYDVIGESWELSAHPDGQSRIAEGYYKGMLFNDYLSIIGKEALGWKCQAQDRFPVLIKFIDAKQALSIQIHPDDEYALENENEYGKNEMWYVLDAEPGAYLYCGLSRASSKEEIEERIKNNTITEILNKIEVKKGDVVMVKAGTIHAIGAGIFICEIQQNSNCTYRMYDYDRRDKFGNPRELHIAKSLDVVNPVKYEKDNKCNVMLAHNEHYMSKRLVQCKYFEVIKYEIEDEAKIPVDEASFLSVIVIDGEGTIMTDDNDKELKFKAGESFFINAGKRNVVVKGRSTCIITHV